MLSVVQLRHGSHLYRCAALDMLYWSLYCIYMSLTKVERIPQTLSAPSYAQKRDGSMLLIEIGVPNPWRDELSALTHQNVETLSNDLMRSITG